ncbi:MAG: oxidoreductase [Verrucomicrobiota bacterium JB022]|nr:oxidoreductase [Verrucomicrobiota bacterium JB022]
MSDTKTFLITGANSGFGFAIAKAAVAAGHRVVGTARSAEAAAKVEALDPERAFARVLDVTDFAAIPGVVGEVEHTLGPVHVLVNNAGYGQIGMFEEQEPEAPERQFATNVFGPMHVTRAVLPSMRERRRGLIFNISAMAGVRGGAGFSLFSASKFALEGFTESLVQEIQPFGLHATLVCPGYFRTDFLSESSIRFGERQVDAYEALAQYQREFVADRNGQQLGDPVKLARILVHLSRDENPPLRLPVGSDAVEALAQKIRRLQDELEEWRELSVTTDYDVHCPALSAS